jgi:hypothetical protein
VLKSYSGRLHKRYSEALRSLREDGPIERKDKRISAFLKAEKFNPLLKPSKPRMIMSRTPRYNIKIASYLKPFEHALYRHWRGACPVVPQTRLVGKGLNGVERASLLAQKMENVGEGCVVFEVDAHSFESHCGDDVLALEHSVYRAGYPGDRQLSELLDVQLVLKGVSTCGVKFRRPGARASGDFNTGLGNTVIMTCTVLAALQFLVEELGMFRYDILCDGDNCLIFVEPSRAVEVHSRFARTVRTLSSQELEVENPVTRLESVVFGQSKPCWNGEEHTMVRNPLKTLSGAFSGYRHYNHYPKFGIKVLKAVSQCELALARGIPVLQAYFAAAERKLSNVPDLKDPASYLEGRLIEARNRLLRGGLGKIEATEITAAARASFAAAWGIDVETQLALEYRLPLEMKFPHELVLQGDDLWDFVRVTDGPDGDGVSSACVSRFLDSKH